MKFVYNAIGEFNSLDIDDFAADPPLYFEYLVNQPDPLREAVVEYMNDMESLDKAKLVILHNIHSVRQGEAGEKFVLSSLDDVENLESAIEENNPEQGSKFIHNLALSSYILRRKREEDKLGNLETSLTESVNGVETERQPLME